MRNLIKSHFNYFFSNKMWILTLVLAIASLAGISILIASFNLILSYNSVFFICTSVITLIVSFSVVYTMFIRTEQNQYDLIIRTTITNRRNIFWSKIIFTFTILISFALIKSIIITIILSISFNSLIFVILFWLSYFFGELLIIAFSVFLFSLIGNNTNLIIKSVHIVGTFVFSVILFIIPLFLSLYKKPIDNNNYNQMISINKNGNYEKHFLRKTTSDSIIDDSNNDFKFGLSFFSLTMATLNNFVNNRIKNNPQFDSFPFSEFVVKTKDIKLKMEINNKYFIYDINYDLISRSVKQIAKLIKTELYKENNNEIYSDAIKKLQNNIWIKSDFSSKETELINLFSGKENKTIQYIYRDWKELNYYNQNLKIELLSITNSKFIDFIYKFYENKNIDTKLHSINSIFYVKSSLDSSYDYDPDLPPSNEDLIYLKNNFISFDNDFVYLIGQDNKTIKIELSKFTGIFIGINNKKIWDDNINKIKKLSEIIKFTNKLSLLDEPNNIIKKINFSPNSFKLSKYSDFVIPYSDLKNSYLLFYGGLVMTFVISLGIANFIISWKRSK